MWEPELDIDYGEPLGVAVEVAEGVWVREWSKATVHLDCNTYTPKIVQLATTAVQLATNAPKEPTGLCVVPHDSIWKSEIGVVKVFGGPCMGCACVSDADGMHGSALCQRGDPGGMGSSVPAGKACLGAVGECSDIGSFSDGCKTITWECKGPSCHAKVPDILNPASDLGRVWHRQ